MARYGVLTLYRTPCTTPQALLGPAPKLPADMAMQLCVDGSLQSMKYRATLRHHSRRGAYSLSCQVGRQAAGACMNGAVWGEKKVLAGCAACSCMFQVPGGQVHASRR